MAAIGLVFYFLILRPSGQARKRHAELLAKLKKGDEVMTSGGIIGKVRDIKEVDTNGAKEVRVTVESGTATVVVERSRIVRVGSSHRAGCAAGMSLLSLHLLGSPVLRQHSAEVKTVDDEVRRLVADLFETMDAAQGVGLAANQVGVARRVAVVDADGDRFAMIDPTIIETEGRATAEEGCLSIPEIYGDVTRPERVVIEALDQEGQPLSEGGDRAQGARHPARDRPPRRHPLPRPSQPDQAADASRPLAPGAQGRHRLHQRGPGGVCPVGVMRIVFFGTPVFAVASLQALLHDRFTVAGVVTQPDKPQGRSRSELIPPPVKVVARAEGIPVLQPVRPVGDVFAASLRRLEPDLGIVVAYGHILRPEILSIPPHGMINVHASLLPRYRGAAPIQHAILHGETETGITIMQMDEGLDSGPMLHRVTTPIGPDETAGALAGRLAELGATALVEAISLCSSGLARPQPQDHSRATYAPKIDREMARLAWQADAASVGATGARLRPGARAPGPR